MLPDYSPDFGMYRWLSTKQLLSIQLIISTQVIFTLHFYVFAAQVLIGTYR